MQVLLIILLLLGAPLADAKTPQTDWDYYQQYGHKSPAWDALVEAGFDTFEGENLNTAVNFLKRARSLGCNDGLVLYKLGLIVEAGGNLQGALEILEPSVSLLSERYKNHPALKTMPEHLGRLYYQLNRYDQALKNFLEAVETTSEDFLKLYLIGQIYRMQEKPKEAIGYFEKALSYPPPREQPGNMRQLAQIELMRLYFDSKNFDQALEMANTLLQENPANPAALSFRDQIRQQRLKEKERKSWERMLNK